MSNIREAMRSRPVIEPPADLAPLLSAVRDQIRPVEVWLFGSRARGDHRPDSDWDLLAVVPDDAPHEIASDPVLAWRIARDSGVRSTLLTTRVSDLQDVWGRVNTLGYDLWRPMRQHTNIQRSQEQFFRRLRAISWKARWMS